MYPPGTPVEAAVGIPGKSVTRAQILGAVDTTVQTTIATINTRYKKPIYGSSGFTASLGARINSIKRKVEQELRREEPTLRVEDAIGLIKRVIDETIAEFRGKGANILHVLDRRSRVDDYSNVSAAIEDAKLLLGEISPAIQWTLLAVAVEVARVVDDGREPEPANPFAEIHTTFEALTASIRALEERIAATRAAQRAQLEELEATQGRSHDTVEELTTRCRDLRETHQSLHARTADPSSANYDESIAAMQRTVTELRAATEALGRTQREYEGAQEATEGQRRVLAVPLPEEGTVEQNRAQLQAINRAILTVVTGVIDPAPTDFAGIESFLETLAERIRALETSTMDQEEKEGAKQTTEKTLEASTRACTESHAELEKLAKEKPAIHTAFAEAIDEATTREAAERKVDLLRRIAETERLHGTNEAQRVEAAAAFNAANEALTAVRRDVETLAHLREQQEALQRNILEAFARIKGADAPEPEPPESGTPAERLSAAIEGRNYGSAIRAALELFHTVEAAERTHPSDVRFQRALITDLIRLNRSDEADLLLKNMHPTEYGHHVDCEEYINLLFGLLCNTGRTDEVERLIVPAQTLLKPEEIFIMLAYTYYYNLQDNQKAQEYCERALAQLPGNKGMLKLQRQITEGQSIPEDWRTTVSVVGSTLEAGLLRTGLTRYKKTKEQDLVTENNVKIIARKAAKGIIAANDYRRLEEAIDAYIIFRDNADAEVQTQWTEKVREKLRTLMVTDFKEGKIDRAYAIYKKICGLTPELLEGANLEEKIAEVFVGKFHTVTDIDMEQVLVIRPGLPNIGDHVDRNDPLATAVGDAILIKIRRAGRGQAAHNGDSIRLGLQVRLEKGETTNARNILNAMVDKGDIIPEGEEDAYEAAVMDLEKRAKK